MASNGPGFEDAIVLCVKTTLAEKGRDSGGTDPVPLLLGLKEDVEFNKPNMRTKISVGAIPCVIVMKY